MQCRNRGIPSCTIWSPPMRDILIGRIDVQDRIATASEQCRIERVIPNISIIMSNARGYCADPSFYRFVCPLHSCTHSIFFTDVWEYSFIYKKIVFIYNINIVGRLTSLGYRPLQKLKFADKSHYAVIQCPLFSGRPSGNVATYLARSWQLACATARGFLRNYRKCSVHESEFRNS